MLRYEGIAETGDRIRAYDFEPREEIGEIFIEGVVLGQETKFGAAGYLIECDNDVCTTREVPAEFTRVGDKIFVPYQLALLEFDGRVTKL